MNTTTTILLVDDLEENLIAMAALLQAPGIRLLRARSGSEALEIVLVNEVALALVDVQMPDMDGFELAELMRGSERTKHVPIIFITAGAHDTKREFRGFHISAVDFLFKPVEPHVLTSKVSVFVELFRQKQALSQVSALQNAIFNSTNYSSIATDANGVIQIFNVGAEHMLGYTAVEVLNQITPADICDPQEVVERARVLSLEIGAAITPGFEALVFKASRGIEDIYELTYIRKDGSRLPAVVSVTALRNGQDTIIGYLLIGTDNTARKRIEDERRKIEKLLHHKNTELESAIAIADKASRAKSDFLSSMSHELRTPLNAILGFAQLIETSVPPPLDSQKRNVDQILKAGWYLLELINEILDLSTIESDRASIFQEPVSLHAVFLECQAMVETQANTRGIGMAFPHIAEPCFVFADRIRIKQVLVNLLSNAIKYNRAEGSVNVESTLLTPHWIRIGVRDTGEGLKPEQLAQLFEPFNRLGREGGPEEGTGIGLVVTKRLVELMGGRLGVDSVVGVGSVFWFELKLTSTALPNAVDAAHVALAPPARPADLLVHTLLYVEDNPANLDLVEQLMDRRADLNLLTATNGPAGLSIS